MKPPPEPRLIRDYTVSILNTGFCKGRVRVDATVGVGPVRLERCLPGPPMGSWMYPQGSDTVHAKHYIMGTLCIVLLYNTK